MRTVPVGLAAHLLEECTTLATCWKITRSDGEEFYFTDHDVDLTVSGDVYESSNGYERTAVRDTSSFAVDSMDLSGFFNETTISRSDIRAGLFDRASVEVFVVNHQDTTQGRIVIKHGTLGEVRMTPSGKFSAEMRGLKQALAQKIGEQIAPECRVELGSTKCSVPLQPAVLGRSAAVTVGQYYRVVTDGAALDQAQYENRIYLVTVAGTTDASQPTYDETVGNDTVDGTATLEAVAAWTRHAVVSTASTNQTFIITITESRAVDDWFNGGLVTWESGNNDGATMEVKDWVQSTNTLTLFLPMPFNVQVGDRLRVYPGCDKRYATCKARFANGINFRGEPFLPGRDWLGRYPNAK